MLNQSPYFAFLRPDNMGYKLAGQIAKGEALMIDIEGIPVTTTTPWSYVWENKKDPTTVNGIKSWDSATLIQTDGGNLASNNTTSLSIAVPIPISEPSFNLGNLFSFNLKIFKGSNITAGVQVVFEVGAISNNPTSPSITTAGAFTRGFITLNNIQATNANFGNAGLDLTNITNGGKQKGGYEAQTIFFVNGQELSTDQYTFDTNGLFKSTSVNTIFVSGDTLSWIFIKQS